MNDFGKDHHFVEGDSDIIDEAHENHENGDDAHGNSFDQVKRLTQIKKGPKSLDDCDGEEGEPMD